MIKIKINKLKKRIILGFQKSNLLLRIYKYFFNWNFFLMYNNFFILKPKSEKDNILFLEKYNIENTTDSDDSLELFFSLERLYNASDLNSYYNGLLTAIKTRECALKFKFNEEIFLETEVDDARSSFFKALKYPNWKIIKVVSGNKDNLITFDSSKQIKHWIVFDGIVKKNKNNLIVDYYLNYFDATKESNYKNYLFLNSTNKVKKIESLNIQNSNTKIVSINKHKFISFFDITKKQINNSNYTNYNFINYYKNINIFLKNTHNDKFLKNRSSNDIALSKKIFDIISNNNINKNKNKNKIINLDNTKNYKNLVQELINSGKITKDQRNTLVGDYYGQEEEEKEEVEEAIGLIDPCNLKYNSSDDYLSNLFYEDFIIEDNVNPEIHPFFNVFDINANYRERNYKEWCEIEHNFLGEQYISEVILDAAEEPRLELLAPNLLDFQNIFLHHQNGSDFFHENLVLPLLIIALLTFITWTLTDIMITKWKLHANYFISFWTLGLGFYFLFYLFLFSKYSFNRIEINSMFFTNGVIWLKSIAHSTGPFLAFWWFLIFILSFIFLIFFYFVPDAKYLLTTNKLTNYYIHFSYIFSVLFIIPILNKNSFSFFISIINFLIKDLDLVYYKTFYIYIIFLILTWSLISILFFYIINLIKDKNLLVTPSEEEQHYDSKRMLTKELTGIPSHLVVKHFRNLKVLFQQINKKVIIMWVPNYSSVFFLKWWFLNLLVLFFSFYIFTWYNIFFLLFSLNIFLFFLYLVILQLYNLKKYINIFYCTYFLFFFIIFLNDILNLLPSVTKLL